MYIGLGTLLIIIIVLIFVVCKTLRMAVRKPHRLR